MIPRLIEPAVIKQLSELRKLVLIFGPRQAGKTTLLQSLQTKLEKQGEKVLYLNGDLAEDRALINTTALGQLKQLLQSSGVVLLDEAQHLDDPGLTLKIIYDNFPKVKVIATGSSSFQLRHRVTDALTGRYVDFTLYPLSLAEIVNYLSLAENPPQRHQQISNLLPSLLLYGFYPEVYLEQPPANKQIFLQKISESYLFKDILAFQKIRRSQAIIDLAQALAYQIGAEVNESELAGRLRIDRKTVASYLDILEQSFVIIRVHPYSTNLRREIGRNYKVYFVDIGLRNALLGDFNSPEVRSDLGSLWENFFILERLKKFANGGQSLRTYFWRTFGGAEVDWLEQAANHPLRAFECKYQKEKLSRGALEFTKQYHLPVELINKSTFVNYL